MASGIGMTILHPPQNRKSRIKNIKKIIIASEAGASFL
jgi:hypothetical protein